MTSRGATLAELVVALALLGLVGGIAAAAVRWAAGAATLIGRRAAEERDATALVALLQHDLAAAVDSEVRVPAATALEFDRPVGEAPVCGMAGDTLLLRAAAWRGERLPAAARDELVVLATADPVAWLRRAVDDVATDRCPDGSNALRIAPGLPVSAAVHVRIVEPVRLRRYASGGATAVGLEHRWNGGVIQPLAGPVDPVGVQWWHQSGALRLQFRGAAGVSASLLAPLE